MLQRAFDTRRAQVSETLTFPAPTGGWVQSGNIVAARPDQAEVLDNFIVTAQGARLRGGCTEYADAGAAVVRMFTYNSGGTEDFFGGTANAVFDLTRLAGGGSNTFGDLEGFTSGDWSTTQISTSGGQFLVGVNGTDNGLYWDGTDFFPVTSAAIDSIDFDTQTAAFTVGETITGGTSGATGVIKMIRKTSATAGTLLFDGNTGVFQNGEVITDGSGGSATATSTRTANVSTITVTGVSESALSQVWLFKERLFFVEKNTSSAWYLPVESIGGAATEIDLGSVFRKGGALLFGATWSLDSGSGLDDVCLFVSDQGEIAVYEGTDPSSASTWALAGVYEIGKPLNKHAYFRAGGDLAIVTEDGIIPVSEALRKDRAALQAVALTYPIEDAWKAAVANRTSSYPISATLWQSGTLLLIGTPDTARGVQVSYIANARTGAWSRILGWDVRCSAVYSDELYFADNTGKVYKADTGGTDAGTAYSAYYVPKFQDAQGMRSANAAQVMYRAPTELTINLYAHSDYEVDDMQVPVPSTTESGAAWGTFVWGTDVWGGTTGEYVYDEWQFVRASGYSLAPGVTITSNQTEVINFELLLTRLRAEGGFAL